MASPDDSADPAGPAPARRSPVPIAVVTLAVLLVALLAYGLLTAGASTNLDTQVQRGAKPPAPAQEVALPRLGELGTATLGELRGGKIAVVNVWASWCPPCEGEAPILTAVQNSLRKTGEGQVIGVTHVDASADSLEKVRAWGLTYPSLRDVDDKVYKAFGATGPPETYVLDPQGRVVALSRGAITAKFANEALAAAGAKARIDPNIKFGDAS